MKEDVISNKSLRRIKAIHRLSQEYNKKLGKKHAPRLLQLIKEHSQEINQLFKANNSHYLVETGDLIILCFEVLLENGTSINKTLLKCFKRYEKKLPMLLKEHRKVRK